MVFTFEALAIAYFIAFAAAAPFRAPRGLARWRGALCSAALAAGILAVAYTTPTGVRVWLGHAYLAAAYWLPVLLVTSVSGTFEAWLARTDVWWHQFRVTLQPWAAHALELSYLLCYVLVPIAFLIVWTSGDSARIDRFWTAVLVAGFSCYGTLPWLVARPPRVLDTEGVRMAGPDFGTRRPMLRGVNVVVLARVSHGHNTFPSGHVAVSVAAALMALSCSWPVGVVMVVIAAGIAAGAVAGGYHYTIDVLGGIGLGAVASLVP